MIRIKIVLILGRGGLLLLLVLVQVVLLGELQVPQELGVTAWTKGDVQKHSIGQVRKEGSDLEHDRRGGGGGGDLRFVVLPFMLMCLLVEGFLIPPRWFFLV